MQLTNIYFNVTYFLTIEIVPKILSNYEGMDGGVGGGLEFSYQ